MPLIQREARAIVGCTHRQSNEKNPTGCGKTSGLWDTRCGPNQTRGQLRCPEAPDPQQESVVLNRNLDSLTGSKGGGLSSYNNSFSRIRHHLCPRAVPISCDNPRMLIGDRLRELREAKKLSQGDIEKRCGLKRAYIMWSTATPCRLSR